MIINIVDIKQCDIYLLDQILKGKVSGDAKVLDIGAGKGRNIRLFIKNDYIVYALDNDERSVKYLHNKYNTYFEAHPKRLRKINIRQSFDFNTEFDFIICNAVLHFAQNKSDFLTMFDNIYNVLKPNGLLFIRMTSNHGMTFEKNIDFDIQVELKDGTSRYLLTNSLLSELKTKYNFILTEPLKSTIVEDLRSMSTIVIKKL